MNKRKFLKNTFSIIKMGGIIYISSLLNCTISDEDITDDLDPPFIDETNSTGAQIVFSGYNIESHFSGYNVWYGSQNDIINAHKQKDRSLVLDRQTTLDISAIGGGTIPSITQENISNISYVKVKTTPLSIAINTTNAIAGDYIYLTAYSIVDNIDSSLSNGFPIP